MTSPAMRFPGLYMAPIGFALARARMQRFLTRRFKVEGGSQLTIYVGATDLVVVIQQRT
jgi:hypothetical protein